MGHLLNRRTLPFWLPAVAVAVGSASPALVAPAAKKAAPAARLAPASPEPLRITSGGENVKPFLLARPGGGVYLAWARREGEVTRIFFAASRDGSTFSSPVPVSAPGMDLDLGAESGPQCAVGPEGTIYVVWNSGVWKEKPAPAASGGHGAGHGGKGGPPPRPGNLNIYLSRSVDGGKSFSAPLRVNDDPDGAEHRFPTVATDAAGTVYVTWLDKRNQNAERTDFSRVYFTRSTDKGKSFLPNVDATQGQENEICHCCKLALAVQPGGGLFLAFRNDVKDMRDIFLTRSTNGATFTKPAPIENIRWMIPSCPMNGPCLSLDAKDGLHAVWMTQGTVLGIPAVGGSSGISSKVLYRRFDTRKQSWGEPLFLAEGIHPRLTAAPNGQAYVAWEGDGIQCATLSPGAPNSIQSFRLSTLEASAAFPSLVVTTDGKVLAAWQQRGMDDRWQVWVRPVVGELGGKTAKR